MDQTLVINGKYRHYRTQQSYEIIAIGLHTETHEEMVVYKALYDCEKFGPGQVWLRPKQMFMEMVEYGDEQVPRFSVII
jgi:hypothetical protein